MMNLFALSLVLTTLLTASVHSPNPVRNKDVIVKEGHRVVMVEYDEEGEGNTKVSISQGESGNFVKSVTDKISGLSGLVGGSKEKLKEDAELAKDVASKSKSLFWGAAENAKDSVTSKAKQASGMAGDVKSRIAGGAKGAAEKTKQGVKQAGEMARRGKGAVGDAVGTPKTLKGKVERNVTNMIRYVWEPIRRFCSGLWHAMFDSMTLYMSVLQLFGFATAYGTAIWMTFMSDYLLAKALPRQQFANMQSKIYPFYFKAMAYSVGLALSGHFLTLLSEGRIRKFVSLGNFQGLNLLSCLGMILANMLYFEPRMSKVMFDKLKWEKEEGREQDTDATTRVTKSEASPTKGTSEVSPTKGTAKATVTTETSATASPLPESESEANRLKLIESSESLKKLHKCSSFLSVLTLTGLTLHLVHLGLRIGTY